MQISRSAKRWIAFIMLIFLFYRLRWGILGIVGIGPPQKACENIEALNTYLHTGGNPSAYLGRVPLIMCATEMGNYEVVSKLIDIGVDVDAQKRGPYLPFILDGDTGMTSLHVSVTEEDLKITKLLFENKADVNWEGLTGISPLNYAIANNRPTILRLFLEADGIDYKVNENAIISAAIDGNIEIFRLLFKADIQLGEIYEKALVRAASKGHLRLVNFLFNEGTSINSRGYPIKSRNYEGDPIGPTALHSSIRSNQIDVVKFLISAGADVNAIDENGDTPLHRAAVSNRSEIAKLLVEAEAVMDWENKEGETPLEVAVNNASLNVVNLLKNRWGSIQ